MRLLPTSTFNLDRCEILMSSNWLILRYPDPEVRLFDRFISDISVVLRENTLTNTDCNKTGSPVESEIVKVVSVIATEISEVTRFT